jgi:glycosyltransferase involved in cell wall biosynthesis
MLPLTIYTLIQNDEKTISATLESLKPLQAEIIALDSGSTDGSIRECHRHRVRVMPAREKDRSKAKNNALANPSNPWQMYIDPWETVIANHQDVIKAVTGPPKTYSVQIIQGDILSKQTRLWHRETKAKFTNPVFETVQSTTSDQLNTILAADPPDRSEQKLTLVEDWQKTNPTSNEPYYYRSCLHLERREYDQFISSANHYLFREARMVLPAIMTRYYLGMVNCYIKNNAEVAIQNLMVCLTVNPMMAEFWCLLGDVYYYIVKQYGKALGLYENAKVLGSRRLKTDTWPLQISKYGEYPDKMIESCRGLVKNAHSFASVTK